LPLTRGQLIFSNGKSPDNLNLDKLFNRLFTLSSLRMNITALYYRLRAMTPAEIAKRTACLAADSWIRALQAQWTDQDWKLEYFRPLLEQPLTCEPDTARMRSALESTGLVARADNLLAGRWILFGRPADLTWPVDWLAEPFGGKRLESSSRLSLWSGIYRREKADIRSIWELNRLQGLVDLGRAFRLTGEKRYADRVREVIETWTAANPYLRTVNWSSALEVGLRSISILLAVSYIRGCSAVLDEYFIKRLSRLLYLHAHYLSGHFSQGSTGFNHAAGEAAAMAVLGSALPGMPDSEKWRARGEKTLEETVLRLILSDGGPLEGSLHYLTFVCRLAVVAAVLCRGEGKPLLSEEARGRLALAYRFLCSVTDRGGSVSEFGDSDDASVPAPAPTDIVRRYRSTFNLLWLFLEKEPLAHHFEPDEESIWLFGLRALDQEASRREPERLPRVERFDTSGRYVLRAAAGSSTNKAQLPGKPEIFLRFECGHWGDGRIWAHSHADRLSFSLFLDSRPFFIDSGTGAYLADRRFREYFRSTLAHNTVTVDRRSQGEPLACFLWRSSVISKLTSLEEGTEETVLEGTHWGYLEGKKESAGLLHRRRIRLLGGPGRLEIGDFFRTGKPHEVWISFILHPDCSVKERNNGDSLLRIANGPLSLSLKPDERCLVSLHRGEKEPPLGWFSRGFSRWEPCWQIICKARIERDSAFTTILQTNEKREEE